MNTQQDGSEEPVDPSVEGLVDFVKALASIPEEVRIEVNRHIDEMNNQLADEKTRAERLEVELQLERSRSDEVMEKITYLRDGCLNMSADELVQKITAVGSAEWKMGHYVNPLLEKERERTLQAQRQK